MPYSGKNGYGTWNGVAIADIRNINVGLISEPQKYASSSTNGHRKELPGHEDETLTFSIYSSEPPMDRGDIGTLVLYAKTGVELFNGTVHISQLQHGVDVDSGALTTTDVTAGPADAA